MASQLLRYPAAWLVYRDRIHRGQQLNQRVSGTPQVRLDPGLPDAYGCPHHPLGYRPTPVKRHRELVEVNGHAGEAVVARSLSAALARIPQMSDLTVIRAAKCRRPPLPWCGERFGNQWPALELSHFLGVFARIVSIRAAACTSLEDPRLG